MYLLSIDLVISIVLLGLESIVEGRVEYNTTTN